MSKNIKDINPLRLLVRPYQNKKLPIYRWYHFNHGFSRDLVWYLIDKFGLGSESNILDPFCGSGTTLLAAKEKAIPTIGIDILPLSAFVCNAKLQNYDTKKIRHKSQELKNLLNNSANCAASLPRIPILRKVFDSGILCNILAIRNWIRRMKDKKMKYFFLTALLSIVEQVAHAKKDGGFLRIVRDKKIPGIKKIITNRINEMLSDIEDNSNPRYNVKSEALLGDARKICFPKASFDAIITSPPYLNRHDYTRVYILELAIGFLESENEIKELRYRTLRSHVEAKRLFKCDGYKEPIELKKIIITLKKRCLPNKQIIPMITGYFEDMYLALKEIARVVRQSGFVALVIGDVRYGGILIPVGEILVKIGNSLGLAHQETLIARMRGNSPQQMGKFGKIPARESIVIWRKK